MIRGIHHFTVHVRDLAKMKRFYMEAFGFEDPGYEGSWSNDARIDEIVDVPNSAARSAMLIAGNCYLEIFQYSVPKRTTRPPRESRMSMATRISASMSRTSRWKWSGCPSWA